MTLVGKCIDCERIYVNSSGKVKSSCICGGNLKSEWLQAKQTKRFNRHRGLNSSKKK